MEEGNIQQELPFFDNTPGLTPEERTSVDKVTEKKQPRQRSRQRRRRRIHRRLKKEKIQGVWALPVYQYTYACMKECMFRFRKLPKGEQIQLPSPIPEGSAFLKQYYGGDAVSILRRVCISISMVYWQIKPKTILPDVFGNMLEAVIIIRALRDMGLLSVHDFGCINRYSGQMVKHMMNWSNTYNKQNPVTDETAEEIAAATSPQADGASEIIVKEP